jgi:hypothetical protein
VIRPFQARFSALSSGPLKELTSIPPPASNGARAFGKRCFRMIKRHQPALQPRYH